MDPLPDYSDIWGLLSGPEQPRERPAEPNALSSSEPPFRLSAYPDDVLLSIFEQLCTDFEARWMADGCNVYDPERAFTPFIIAAVCVRWRRLALSMQRLWTYIALPRPSVHLSVWRAQRAHIALALERSGTSALDVLVRSKSEPLGRNNLLWFLTTVGPHVHRWGRVELWGLRKEDLDILTAPTPLLTHLMLHVDFFAGGHRPAVAFLPSAPRLRCLTFVDAQNYTVNSEGHQGFPALRSLVFRGNALWQQIGMLVAAACSSLESVTITIGRFPLESDSLRLPSVALPRLRKLIVTVAGNYTPSWSWNWIMPNLTTLCLHSAVIHRDPGIAPLLRQTAATVTQLTLFGSDITEETLRVVSLRDLHNVARLTLGTIRLPDSQTTRVADSFFVALAETTPPIWPLLRCIELDSDVDSTGRKASKSSSDEGLLLLIAARRTGSRAAGNDGALPSGVEAISEIVISEECSGCSPELKQEVARLMRESDS